MKKYLQFPRLVALLVVAASLAIAGCGSSSNTPEPMVEPPPPPPPAGPTDLEQTQADAAAAAAAAMTASTAAAASAASAATATEDIATHQTNGMAASYAKMAQMAAAAAMAAYETAKGAAASAASATESPAAEDARGEALLAQATAEAEAMKAAEAAMKAAEAATMELQISEKINYSVGGSSLTIDERTSSPDGKTGHQASESVETTIAAVRAQAGRVDNHNTPADEGVAHRQMVDERTVSVGVVYDTSDDKARLLLVNKYGGSATMGVFLAEGTSGTTVLDATTDLAGNTKAGIITVTVDGTATDFPLRSVGMHYAATDVNTDTALDAADTVTVTGTTKPREVFSFQLGTETRYVILASAATNAAGVTTYVYDEVDVTAPFEGSAGTALGGAPNAGERPPEQRKVTAAIPMAMEYKYINFGVWASLADEGTNKGNQLDELGIGFVQNHSGGGMTSEMPNNGSATYTGNWAATVRTATGLISLNHGGATLAADFEKDTIKATLAELATLSGTIAGSTFSGTSATSVVHAGLHAPDSSFTGSFGGAFYGALAAEAGGTFDFSDGKANGEAFRGSFGGAKDE